MVLRDYQRLKEIDANDILYMAHANSSYLHYSVDTPQCKDPIECKLCFNAARLAVQHYRPIIEKRTVRTFVDYFNAGCTMTHSGDD